MKKFMLVIFGWLAVGMTVQAASFDCSDVSTAVEKMICDNPDISKLDDELDAEYKRALRDHTRAGATRLSQKMWLFERKLCLDANCLKGVYVARIKHFQAANVAVVQSHKSTNTEQPPIIRGNTHEKLDSSTFKGAFVLREAFPGSNFSVCERFTGNLNQFRNLDFDQCNTRLSEKFTEFSRPYTWKEIPFDMKLAEKAIRSTVNITELHDPEMIATAHKMQEERWLAWKNGSESLRVSGKARMWITKIDIDGDGKPETILRMVPGGRYAIDPKRPSLWSCDYNIGELYVVDSASPRMAASFNEVAGSSSDIIHYAEDNHFYLLSWESVASSRLNGWFNHLPADIGGTRGVTIRQIFNDRNEDINYFGPTNICLIDWVPTGHEISATHHAHK